MKTQITNISLYQNAKFLAILYFPFTIIMTFVGIILLLTDIEAIRVMAFSYIFAPLWMPGIVFVSHYLIATIYNYLASKIGGIEFELTEIEE